MKYLASILLLAVILVAAFNESQDSFKTSALNESISISFKGDVLKGMDSARPWMNPVVTKQELSAIEWVKANTPKRKVFVTDIFGGELLMSNLREGTEGGDWAIVPNVVERMSDVQNNFYQADGAEKAWNTARKYNASFVWAPDRQVFAGFGWTVVPDFLNNTQYFEKVFDNGARIYRIK